MILFEAPDQIPHMVNEVESDRSIRRVLSRLGRSSDGGQIGWVTVRTKPQSLLIPRRRYAFQKAYSVCHEQNFILKGD